MKKSREIPYFGQNISTGVFNKIKEASEKRKINPFFLVFRKIRNNFLFKLALRCKYNGLRIKMHRWRGVNIGENVYIAKDCMLDNSYPDYIYIEDNVAIAGGVSILTHTNPYLHFQEIV